MQNSIMLVVVLKVMFAHSYSKNSHECAKEESYYALLKSLVIRRWRNEVTDGHCAVMLAERSMCPVMQWRNYEGHSTLFLWLGPSFDAC